MTKQEVTETEGVEKEHVSDTRKKKTIKQVQKREQLLQDFIDNGVPEGFTAHTAKGTFLAYENEERGLESITYNAAKDKGLHRVYAKLDELNNKLEKQALADAPPSRKEQRQAKAEDQLQAKTEEAERFKRMLLEQRSAYNNLVEHVLDRYSNDNTMRAIISGQRDITHAPISGSKKAAQLKAVK